VSGNAILRPGEAEGSSGDGEPSGDLPQDEPRHDDERRHRVNGGTHPPVDGPGERVGPGSEAQAQHHADDRGTTAVRLRDAAWNAIKTRGRLQARYNRLVRRFGGEKNPGAKKKAITAIAHTLLKIAYQVLKSGTPCTDLGAGLHTRRESPAEQHAYLERRLQKLYPGRVITITISPPETALPPALIQQFLPQPAPEAPPIPAPRPPAGQTSLATQPRHHQARVHCRAPA
jgi:hypothetical protein